MSFDHTSRLGNIPLCNHSVYPGCVCHPTKIDLTNTNHVFHGCKSSCILTEKSPLVGKRSRILSVCELRKKGISRLRCLIGCLVENVTLANLHRFKSARRPAIRELSIMFDTFSAAKSSSNYVQSLLNRLHIHCSQHLDTLPLSQLHPHREALPGPECALVSPVVAFRVQLDVKVEQEAADHGADLVKGKTVVGEAGSQLEQCHYSAE